MTVKINDVAKLANVSNGTVSKVLKNYPNISKETKDKVLKAIKELNYIPNYSASQLSSKKKNKIALILNIDDTVCAIDEKYMQYILGAFSTSKEKDVEITVIFRNTIEHYSTNEVIQYLISLNINGLVIYGLTISDTTMHEIIKREIFWTTLVDVPISNSKTSYITINHTLAQYQVIEKLLEPNFDNRTLYIAGSDDSYITKSQLEAIELLRNDYQIDIDIIFGNNSERNAYQITKDNASKYDIIACASDLMAIGAIHALVDLDIFKKCCGFDGLSLVAYAERKIYTCYKDYFNISKQALDLTLKLITTNINECLIVAYQIKILDYHEIIK